MVQCTVSCILCANRNGFFLIILSCPRHLSVSLGEAGVNRDKCNLSALQWHGIRGVKGKGINSERCSVILCVKCMETGLEILFSHHRKWRPCKIKSLLFSDMLQFSLCSESAINSKSKCSNPHQISSTWDFFRGCYLGILYRASFCQSNFQRKS